MNSSDSRFEKIRVDGQEMLVPSPEAWELLWREPELDGYRIPGLDLLKRKVATNAAYSELVSCLAIAYRGVMFYELLRWQGELYRVFVEAVICEHCGYRATLSATPSASDRYFGCPDRHAAEARSFSLPKQNCYGCGNLLWRRTTVWQVNAPARLESAGNRGET